jgi:hypothetical protein
MSYVSGLGLKAGSKIKIIGNLHCTFGDGDIVTLNEDDGSTNPFFTCIGDGRYSAYSLDVYEWERYKEEEKDPTLELKAGYTKDPLLVNDGWIEWKGDSESPVPVGTKLDIKYGDGVIATNVGNQDDSTGEVSWRSCTSWKHWQGGQGADIVAYRIHKPSVASQEAITERSQVSIDLGKETLASPIAPLVSVIKEVTYTVTIKGTEFTFTQDELNELTEELLGFSYDF